MKVFRAVLFLAGLLATLPVSAAQKTIIISDSLAANADKLDVQMGAQWLGKIAKWSFGDYAVVSSKMGPTTIRTKENLLKTKTESKSTNNFSFVLRNRTNDSATVDAAHNTSVKSLQHLSLGKGFFLGSDELVEDSDNFTAFITINGDTTDTWTLFMGSTRAAKEGGGYQTFLTAKIFLTNGARNVSLLPVSSDKEGYDARRVSILHLPAMGYEFVENGQSLCALQYFGGLSRSAYVVWLRRSSDTRMKLILAAAMTALLQMTSSESHAVPTDQD